MGLFGKPPAGGSAKQPEPKSTGKSGKSTDKANASPKSGKSFAMPSVAGGTSSTGFEPGGPDAGDRWSHGSSAEQPASAHEWGAAGNESWNGGGVWQNDGWNGTRERRNEW